MAVTSGTSRTATLGRSFEAELAFKAASPEEALDLLRRGSRAGGPRKRHLVAGRLADQPRRLRHWAWAVSTTTRAASREALTLSRDIGNRQFDRLLAVAARARGQPSQRAGHPRGTAVGRAGGRGRPGRAGRSMGERAGGGAGAGRSAWPGWLRGWRRRGSSARPSTRLRRRRSRLHDRRSLTIRRSR